MALPNIFTKEISQQVISRINALTDKSQPNWGKMDVAKMLAHCNVTYEYVYENKHPKPNAILKFMLKIFLKKIVVGEKDFKKNSSTGPDFMIKSDKNFEQEKNRLIAYIEKTQALGGSHFDGKESHSFGVLTQTEWNNMFYKHLNHHLNQFGV